MTTPETKTATTDALPALDSPYPLSAAQIESYQQNGHILLRGVATPEEIAVYGPAIIHAADAFNTETRSMEERDTYGKAFLQIMNLWKRDEIVRRYTLARRFGRIAAELMGVEGVRLYHDQALFKEPHGGPTPWHQDQYYWPLDTDNTVTMWMPLVDISATMGALTFASGSQREGFLGHTAISDASETLYDNLVRERGYPLAVSPMAAGDATFHSGWTLHNAPGNPTDRMRSVMTIIYLADGTRITEPDNPHRVNDIKTWMSCLAPGDLVASPLNPLVYSRQN
jgi:ectoine hydroxylase-related dioxygenase (phytanoyl-CoA dioxygenase family)